jgi:hypothetical protein
MKRMRSKLHVGRETIKTLQSSELRTAVGAGKTGSSPPSEAENECRLTDYISKGAKYYTCWTHQAEP